MKKKFKSYTAKKLKLWRRIIFFAVVAVLIFIFAVILGNILKNRLAEADIDTSEIPAQTEDDTKDEPSDEASVPHDEIHKSVSAGCLLLSGETDAAGAAAAVDTLKNEGCNAVSFSAVGEDNKVSYASPALEQAYGIKSSESLVGIDILRIAFARADSLGMRCCIVFGSCLKERDAVIASELGDIGADDILVRGYEKLSALDNSTVGEMTEYAAALRADSNMSVGISLSADIYTVAKNAPYIEKLYRGAEYLAIDMTGADGTSSAELVSALQGSFGAYSLRCVLQGINTDAAAAVKGALDAENIKARQYISRPAPPPPQTDGSDTTDGED